MLKHKHWKSYILLFNDMINIEVFDSNLLKIDKKSYKNVTIYNIGYITTKKIDDYESIYSVNPLYLIIGEVDGFIEEKTGGKYLAFDSADKNKEVLKNYREYTLCYGIKNEIKTINDGKEGEYRKDLMKIKFDTDDGLPLNKPLKLNMLTIVDLFLKKIGIRWVFVSVIQNDKAS